MYITFKPPGIFKVAKGLQLLQRRQMIMALLKSLFYFSFHFNYVFHFLKCKEKTNFTFALWLGSRRWRFERTQCRWWSHWVFGDFCRWWFRTWSSSILQRAQSFENVKVSELMVYRLWWFYNVFNQMSICFFKNSLVEKNWASHDNGYSNGRFTG